MSKKVIKGCRQNKTAQANLLSWIGAMASNIQAATTENFGHDT
nr:hypothetical protein [Pseudomonas luteola]